MEKLRQSAELDKPRLAGELYDRNELEAEAWRLIRNREKIEHDLWAEEPAINARTAIFEELTAKGHLSRVEFPGPIEEVNRRTLRRLVNGWSDLMPQWEQERRLCEIVEELTIHRVADDIRAGRLPDDTLVITISNIPEAASADGLSKELASRIGYGVLNQKGMVRSTGFESGVRVLEQVSRSQSNDGSAEHFFMDNGYVVGRGPAAIIRNQLITSKQHFPDGVVDVQRALDSIAGPNIIYGEDRDQAGPNLPEYEDLRQVSAERERQAHRQISKLAEFERQLDIRYKAGAVSYEEKLRAINNRRKELVTEICVLDPSYAKDARGEATVEYFENAGRAMAAGDDAAGIRHLENALAAADPRAGAVCGGAGIETATNNSNNLSAAARRLYLEAKADRKYWQWKKGVCLVKECPSRPAKTDVGPCSVCRRCQGIFDNGDNPKNVYKTLGFLDIFFASLRESSQKFEAEQAAKKTARLKKAA